MNEPIFGLCKFDEQDRIEKMVDNLSDLFHRFCEDGELDIAKLFCNKIKKYNEGVTRNGKVIEFNLIEELDINNELFGNVCSNGHLEVAQWLYSLHSDIIIDSDPKFDENNKCDFTVNGYLFERVCSNGHLEMAQWIYSVIPNIIYKVSKDENKKIFNFSFFEMACGGGHLEIAKWLYSLVHNFDILGEEYEDSNVITFVSESDQLNILKWMFSINKSRMIREITDIIYISSNYGSIKILNWLLKIEKSQIIRESQNILQNGIIMNKMNVVEWILEIKPDVSISKNENKLFHHVCKKKYLHMAQWFHTQNPDKFHFIVNEDGSITPNIQVIILYEKNVEKVDTCSICLESESFVVTICDHQYCKNCIVEWYKKNPTCAYCRRKLEDKSDLFYIKK